jgi:phosphate transport system substrate-binding protein
MLQSTPSTLKTILAGIRLLACVACTAAAPHVEAQVRGAGATFPAPIYQQWFAQFSKQTGTTVDYQSVGSGKGYDALKNKTVDFGASDAPLSAQEEAALPGRIVHVPTVGGAVALTYNLLGVGNGLQLTPDVIADIFLGRIRVWNDPRIVGANPGKRLPATPIKPVCRTEGSGTTYIFTHYLKKVSGAWASGPGAGKSVNWPAGVGVKGNPGVAAQVRRLPGTIGYVELAFALENKLAYAAVKNRAGKFVLPSVESTTAAIGQYTALLTKDIKTPTVDAPGADSYPICSLTYILIYQNGGNGGPVTKLWSWALQPAQQAMAKTLYYAPLPPALVRLNMTTLKSVQGAQVGAER